MADDGGNGKKRSHYQVSFMCARPWGCLLDPFGHPNPTNTNKTLRVTAVVAAAGGGGSGHAMGEAAAAAVAVVAVVAAAGEEGRPPS